MGVRGLLPLRVEVAQRLTHHFIPQTRFGACGPCLTRRPRHSHTSRPRLCLGLERNHEPCLVIFLTRTRGRQG